MNLQLEAAWKLHQVLAAPRIQYVLIGGLAVQHWGEPRLTRDVDATVLVSPGNEGSVIDVLVRSFETRLSDAREFALANRVLLLRAPGMCDLDISFGLPGYEEHVAFRCARGAGEVAREVSAGRRRSRRVGSSSPDPHALLQGRDVTNVQSSSMAATSP